MGECIEFRDGIQSLTDDEYTWCAFVLGMILGTRSALRTENGGGAPAPKPEALADIDEELLRYVVENWDSPGINHEFMDGGVELKSGRRANGDPQLAGHFVRAFLARFRPERAWSLTWSWIGHRHHGPIYGGNGGGVVVVDANSVRQVTTAVVRAYMLANKDVTDAALLLGARRC